MPVGKLHGVKDLIDERALNLLVELVAHRIDKNHPWALPPERLSKTIGSQGQIKTGFKRVSWDAAEPFREAFRTAIVAATADLRATPVTGYHVPSVHSIALPSATFNSNNSIEPWIHGQEDPERRGAVMPCLWSIKPTGPERPKRVFTATAAHAQSGRSQAKRGEGFHTIG
jgi:hypothetical protein